MTVTFWTGWAADRRAAHFPHRGAGLISASLRLGPRTGAFWAERRL